MRRFQPVLSLTKIKSTLQPVLTHNIELSLNAAARTGNQGGLINYEIFFSSARSFSLAQF